MLKYIYIYIYIYIERELYIPREKVTRALAFNSSKDSSIESPEISLDL